MMLPFFDSCNSFVQTKKKSNFFPVFKIVYDKTSVEIIIQEKFIKNGEIFYNYTGKSEPNSLLIETYGFYVKNNITKFFTLTFTEKINEYQTLKHDLCLKLNCYEKNSFYDDSQNYFLTVKITPNDNSHLLNFFRLDFSAMDEGINISESTFNKLILKKSLSYENEVKSLFQFGVIIRSVFQKDISFPDMIHIKQNSRNIYVQNGRFINDDLLLYQYKLRKTHFYQAFEWKQIILQAYNRNLNAILDFVHKDIKFFVLNNN